MAVSQAHPWGFIAIIDLGKEENIEAFYEQLNWHRQHERLFEACIPSHDLHNPWVNVMPPKISHM